MNDWKKYFQPKAVQIVGPSFDDFMCYMRNLLYTEVLTHLRMEVDAQGLRVITVEFLQNKRFIIPEKFQPFVAIQRQHIHTRRYTQQVNVVGGQVTRAFPTYKEDIGEIDYVWIGY